MSDSSNRSVSIGGAVSGSVIQTGNQNVATLTTTTLPPAESVDMNAVIQQLRAMIDQLQMEPKQQLVAKNALDEAVKSAGRKIAVDGSEERNKVEDALYAFRWACINCEDLCPDDGQRVADLTQQKIEDFIDQSSRGLKKGMAATRSLDDIEEPATGFSLNDIDLFPGTRA